MVPDGAVVAPTTVGWSPETLARRAYTDLRPGQYVNLGIGLPVALLQAATDDPKDVVFQSENGILGLAALPERAAVDPDLIDAGKNPAAPVVGGAYFSHVESFAMIRGGHVDVAVLGAYEVAASDDFANWSTKPDAPLSGDPRTRSVPAVGGAVDLAQGAGEVWVLLRTIRRGDAMRLVRRCTLPLTGAGCVMRVYCDAGVLRPNGTGFAVEQLADGYPEQDLVELFEASRLALDFD
jgi:3-oxoadipate CoA-transferase beta subunit